MASLKSKSALVAVLLAGIAAPALADDDANYGSRSDFVTLDAGNAPQSNIAIQTPTPWPSNVKDTRFRTPARLGTIALEKMYKHYESSEGEDAPSTIINVGK